jgi:hypothetical protein
MNKGVFSNQKKKTISLIHFSFPMIKNGKCIQLMKTKTIFLNRKEKEEIHQNYNYFS